MQLPWREVSIGRGKPILTSLTANEATTLRALAADRLVLEIGSAYGYSSIVMAHSAEHVLAVDPHAGPGSLTDSLTAMRENLIAYRVEHKVGILLGASQQTLPMLHRLGCRFGLVFIDGDHTRAVVENDLRWALKLLHDNGMLACHDFGEESCEGVKAALDATFPSGPDQLVDTLWIRCA